MTMPRRQQLRMQGLRFLLDPARTYVAFLFVHYSASFSPFHPTITTFRYPISNVYDYTRPFAGIGPTISSHILWLIHMVRRGTCTMLLDHRTGIREPHPRRGFCPYFIAMDTVRYMQLVVFRATVGVR